MSYQHGFIKIAKTRLGKQIVARIARAQNILQGIQPGKLTARQLDHQFWTMGLQDLCDLQTLFMQSRGKPLWSDSVYKLNPKESLPYTPHLQKKVTDFRTKMRPGYLWSAKTLDTLIPVMRGQANWPIWTTKYPQVAQSFMHRNSGFRTQWRPYEVLARIGRKYVKGLGVNDTLLSTPQIGEEALQFSTQELQKAIKSGELYPNYNTWRRFPKINPRKYETVIQGVKRPLKPGTPELQLYVPLQDGYHRVKQLQDRVLRSPYSTYDIEMLKRQKIQEWQEIHGQSYQASLQRHRRILYDAQKVIRKLRQLARQQSEKGKTPQPAPHRPPPPTRTQVQDTPL